MNDAPRPIAVDLAAAEAALAARRSGPGIGRVRYGAAMSLWQAGRLSAAALEVYRRCSLLDGQDPAPLLAEAAALADRAVRALIGAARDYLAAQDDPAARAIAPLIDRHAAGPAQAAATHPAARDLAAQWLPAALQSADMSAPALAAAIRAAAAHLSFVRYDRYDPALIGENFQQGHAFASLVGEDASVRADGFELGLFIIAPHVLYRDHAHPAPELYAPLTGPHGWRFAPGDPIAIRPAHRPVWNDAHRPHLIKVGPRPFLALFAWTADVTLPAYVIPADDWDMIEAMRIAEDAA
jgi:hypothetical protein